MTDDLLQRVDELVKWLRVPFRPAADTAELHDHHHEHHERENKAADLVEQLLSENRQVREDLEEMKAAHPTENTNHASHHEALAQWMDDWTSAQSTIASLRQDLDRISAEREAYREKIEDSRGVTAEEYAQLNGWKPCLCHRAQPSGIGKHDHQLWKDRSRGTACQVFGCDCCIGANWKLARRILAENDR